jgi:hypothetical protein
MSDDAWEQHGKPIAVACVQHRGRRALVAGVILSLISAAIGAEPEAGKLPRATPATTGATTRPFPSSPAAHAVQRFHDLLKSDRQAEAAKLLAASPTPVRDADRRLKRLAAALAGGSWDFTVVDAKDAGQLAVVIINEQLKDGRKTIDLKPWYLLRQDGQWKLLAKYTDFELTEYGFDETTLSEYRKLEEWAHRREPDLRRELPDCGC